MNSRDRFLAALRRQPHDRAPVWIMRQRRIDEVLDGVFLADLLHAEPAVRQRVGLPVLQA